MKDNVLTSSPLQRETYYYTFYQDDFYYGSTLTLLLEQLPASPKVNHLSMQAFIEGISLNPEQTMYEHIYKVPPGHQLTQKGNAIQIERLWHPASISTDYTLSFQDATKRFKTLFKKALLNTVPHHEKFACDVSGGFDSSSIFSVLKTIDKNVTTLTMDMHHESCNEQHYVNEALKSHVGESIRIDAGNLDYKETYNMDYTYRLSEHWPVYATFSMYLPLIEALKEKKIKYLFTGHMGDQLMMSDSSVVFHYFKRLQWKTFCTEWRVLPRKWQWFYKQIQREILSILSKKHKNVLKKIFFIKDNSNKPLKEYTDEHRFSSLAQKKMIHEFTSHFHTLFLHNSLSTLLKEHYDITVIQPFADLELVEFMFSVPPEYKYSLGNPRHFHGEALRGILPDAIINRRDKAEFSVIILQQIEAIDRKSLWENPSLVTLNLITQKEIMKHENMYLQKKLKGYDLQRYWRMINLEYWYNLNKYIDKGV